MPGKLTHGKEVAGFDVSSAYMYDEFVTRDLIHAVLHGS
jgi:hypothetical protein